VYSKFQKFVIHDINFISDLFICIYSGGWGVKFMKHIKGGGTSSRRLGTCSVVASLGAGRPGIDSLQWQGLQPFPPHAD
jgi:hypothetical protein